MSDEYIKKSDAIRAVKDMPYDTFFVEADRMWLIAEIDKLPSADVVERKRGRWILSEDQDEIEVANGNFRFKCSNCGASDIHSKRTIVRYCWDCGADMRGADDE